MRTAHLVVLYLPGQGTSGSRFGVTVSRKVGGAVVRNRVKRWLREAIRRQRQGLLGTWDVVFVALPQSAAAGYGLIYGDVGLALTRIARGAR